MRVIVLDNAVEISKQASEIIIKQVNKKKDSVIGFATGASPVETYKRIIVDCLNPDKTRITPYYRFIPETIDLNKDEIRIKSINVIL